MRKTALLRTKVETTTDHSADLTDWDKFDADHVDSYKDDPEDAFDWTDAVIVQRPGKAAVSIRVDADVLDFFKAGGKGWQTRINAVLRAWMEAQQAKAGR